MVQRRASVFRGSKWYEIVVLGEFDARFASAFEEMTIQTEGGRTHIIGEVIDQSQLLGLLDQVRNLGIELISVNLLAVGTARPASGGEPEADEPPQR
jgi:hypothetical protein